MMCNALCIAHPPIHACTNAVQTVHTVGVVHYMYVCRVVGSCPKWIWELQISFSPSFPLPTPLFTSPLSLEWGSGGFSPQKNFYILHCCRWVWAYSEQKIGFLSRVSWLSYWKLKWCGWLNYGTLLRFFFLYIAIILITKTTFLWCHQEILKRNFSVH